MEQRYAIADYDFMFQTKGVFFFFADIVAQLYCPPRNIIYSQDDIYEQYSHKYNRDYFQKMYEEGLKDKGSLQAYFDRFEKARDEMFALKARLEAVGVITLTDYDNFIRLAGDMQRAYSVLEPMVTDKLFAEKSEKNQELIELILEKKNVYRFEFNQLFFNQDSCLMLVVALISKQRGTTPSELSYLSIAELREVLAGKSFVDHYLGSRDYAVIREENGSVYYYGAEARAFIEEFTKDKDKSQSTELKGTSVAKKGIFKGVVKKVNVDYNDLEGSIRGMTIPEGDFVLVTDSTVPEMLPLMSKSIAIVTNTGGLLSHAAITSRELGIPCIVDTRTATKLFADGDVVEVDADKGIVRKI